VRVHTVTTLVRSSEGSELRTEPSVDLHVLERDDIDRPGGRRFGTLVHSLLALIDLESTSDALKKTAAVQGRILGATEEEIDVAVATVSRALAHPILRMAAASARTGGLRREVPVLLRTNGGSLVDGSSTLPSGRRRPPSPVGRWWISRPIASLEGPLIGTWIRCDGTQRP
jgi:hypothetical protein